MTNDRIYAPNVHLFAFHLYDSENSDRLWEYYKNTIAPQFQLKPALDLYQVQEEDLGKRLELWTEATDDNTSLFVTGNLADQSQITGRVYPLLIYDGYALGLNLRIPERDSLKQLNEPVDLRIFRDFNPDGCLLPQNLDSNLGQTILLTAWLTSAQGDRKGEWREIAQKILTNFLGESQSSLNFPRLYQTGFLFNSPCFEYGSPQYVGKDGKIQHYIVWLFLNEADQDKLSLQSLADTSLGTCYPEFVDLFFYRHKMTTAYQNSRQYYGEIKISYKQLKVILNKIAPSLPTTEIKDLLSDVDLRNLQEELRSLPKFDLDYSENLQKLKNNHLTIKINHHGYCQKIKQIEAKCYTQDLVFLEDFSATSSTKFKSQIMDDLSYFSHGSDLADKAIASIRGIVEIEQAESDRSLERTIQILATGLGAGGIVASAVSGHVDKPLVIIPQENTQIHPAVTSVVLSLFAALLFGGLAGTIPKFLRAYL